MSTTIDTTPATRSETVRAEIRAVIAAEGLKMTDIARMSGVKYGTLTPFMGGTYPSDDTWIADELSKWLETRKSASATSDVLPKAPSFVQTPTSAEVMSVLQFAHAAPDFVVVVGGAGIGKTTTIEEYQRTNSNVWVWTAEPSLKKTHHMLAGIAEVMDLSQRQATLMSGAIIRRVKNANALIIVDEAQHLETSALDQLRTIHDKGQCGIVVAGNETLLARLKGGAGAADTLYAQLYSRAGMRMTRPNTQGGDVTMLLDAWGIEGDAARKMLGTVARKPGALRIMTKVIRLATMMARGAGETLDAVHIQRAFGQLSSNPLDAA